MTPRLRVSRDHVAVEAEISLLHARVIMLLASIGAEHCLQEPSHDPVVHGRLAQTIEGALQQTPSAHVVWLRLCERTELPIQVDVMGLDARDGASWDDGGDGGDGAWPGGGGGGGGVSSGTGGSGGDGALVMFHLAEDGTLVDVEALVMSGTSTWTCPEGVVRAKLVGCGGGGGGGGGAAPLTRVRK
jgi:hypothetical protein